MDIKLQILSTRVKALMVLLLTSFAAQAQFLPGGGFPVGGQATLKVTPKDACGGDKVTLEALNMQSFSGYNYTYTIDGITFDVPGGKGTRNTSISFNFPKGVETIIAKVEDVPNMGWSSFYTNVTATINRKRDCKPSEDWTLSAESVCNGDALKFTLAGNTLENTPIWKNKEFVVPGVKYFYSIESKEKGFTEIADIDNFTMPLGVEKFFVKAQDETGKFYTSNVLEIKRKADCGAMEKWTVNAKSVCNGERISLSVSGNNVENSPVYKGKDPMVPAVKYYYSMVSATEGFEPIADLVNFKMPLGTETIYIKAEDETGKFYKSAVMTYQRKEVCALKELFTIESEQTEVCNGDPITFILSGNTVANTPLWKNGAYVVPGIKYFYSKESADKGFEEIADISNFTMPEGVETIYVRAVDETGKFYQSNALKFTRKSDCPIEEKWTIFTEQTEVCEGEPIVLVLSGFKQTHIWSVTEKKYETTLARYQYSTDGINFKDMDENVNATANDTFVFDMPDGVEMIYVRAVDRFMKFYTSNTIVVKKTDACPAGCHITSTGDIFQGTDFDPVDPNDTNPRIPNGVDNYFGENSIGFDNNGFDDYTVMEGLNSDFGGLQPSMDNNGGKNFYYNFNGIPGNKQPFVLRFPKEIYHGKSYTFVMRMYVYAKRDCNQWQNSQIIARTLHGTVTSDTLEVRVYNDRTNQQLGQTSVKGKDGDCPRFFMTDVVSPDVLMNYPDLLRVEMTFYGTFPEKEQENLAFTPEFGQFDCGYVAIDYISAQAASICMTKGSECVGNFTTVNAAGFPRSSIYHWEEQDPVTGDWKPLYIDGVEMTGPQYNKVDIPVKRVGVTHYRLWNEKASRKADGEIEYFEFKVVGRNCNPDCPKLIVGSSKICTPGNEPVVYTADPKVNADKYPYQWSLYGPDGSKIEDSKVIFPTYEGQTHTYSVLIPETYPEGKYKMSLVLKKSEGDQLLEFCGDGIDTTLEVVHRPVAKVLVNGETSSTICPFRNDVKFSSKETNDAWVYDWDNAIADKLDPSVALVDFPDGICSMNTFTATLNVSVKDFPECAATDNAKFDVDKTTPEINCDALKNGDYDFYLEATETEKTITLPVPDIKATCDPNPTVVIAGTGTLSDGSKFEYRNDNAKLNDLKNGIKITIPATASKKNENDTEEALKATGIRFTYVAKDSCGRLDPAFSTESDTCEFFVFIRDTFPPAIDCEKILPRVFDVKLSVYEDTCVAIPGKYPEVLPFLPKDGPIVLVDSLNDEEYEAIFDGRTHNNVRTDADAVKLNDPYEVGSTTIHWLFKDFSGNTQECEQKVNVTDDKKPEVICPALKEFKVFPEDTGDSCTVSAAGVIDQIKQQLITNGLKLPVGIDHCESKDTITEPTYYYKEKDATEWILLDVNDPTIRFEMKIDYQISWRFYKIAGEGVDDEVYDECIQEFRVIDNKAPKANCDEIPDVKYIVAPTGKCEAVLKHIKADFNPWPTAVLKCTGDIIPGEIVRADGVAWDDNTVVKVGDSIRVLWIFRDPTLTTGADTCWKSIKLISDIKPDFDCDNIPDFIKVTAPSGTCEAPISAFMDSLKALLRPWPTATERCTGDSIPGVIMMANGDSLPKEIPVGTVLDVKWVFKDSTKTTGVNDDCKKQIKVISDKGIQADCNNESYKDIHFEVTQSECKLPFDTLGINEKHYAPHPCIEDYIIEAIPSRSDGLALKDSFPVGTTVTITWLFKDTTESLVDNDTVCRQNVSISDQTIPGDEICGIVFPDTTIKLDAENCTADFSQLSLHLDKLPVHPCTGLKAQYEGVRTDGKLLTDPYEVGEHNIVWKIWFVKGKELICNQKIVVKDTIAPNFKCEQIEKNSIVIEYKGVEKSVPIDTIYKHGLVFPVVTDKCTEVVMDTFRSDGKFVSSSYPVGEKVYIYVSYRDIYNNATDTCAILVHVTDMLSPTINCPSTGLDNLSCIDQIPAAYNSLEEFKAAGGTIDPEEKIIPGTFHYAEQMVGDSCNSTTYRNYMFQMTNGDTVGCQNPQEYTVIDNVAPVISGVEVNSEYSTTCYDADTVPPLVTVSDNCDPNVKLHVSRVSFQGGDPSKCDFYQYDVLYTYNAVDRCGNAAETKTYRVHVLNNEPPVVTAPEGWQNPAYPEILGDCKFGAPNIVEDFPIENVSLVCGNKEYVKVYQIPPVGTVLEQTTIIQLVIEDVCGNKTVLEKTMIMQTPEQRLNVVIKPLNVVCGDENVLDPRNAPNNLQSSDIRLNTGKVYKKDFDGEYVMTDATVAWDTYREKIAPENLVYSENKYTYGHLFADAIENDDNPEEVASVAFAKYNLLTRRHQSGKYIYVAYDTITGCMALDSTYINVLEKPRIAIESNTFNLCDGDSLTLLGRFGMENPVCAEDGGAPIIAYGWALNGEPYVPKTPVVSANGEKQTAYFYATNICGTTTTLNSLYYSCSGAPVTIEDSIMEAGSLENFVLWRQDKLWKHDSVIVDIYNHVNPSDVLLTTKPDFPSRVWDGEPAELLLTTPSKVGNLVWMRVVGEYDGMQNAVYNEFGNVVSGGSFFKDDIVLQVTYNGPVKAQAEDVAQSAKFKFEIPFAVDTASYYVLVGNGVCPTVSSNIVKLDIAQIPTAFTPYERDGFNDVFMKGHHVTIFNRYGGKVFEGNDGWDGKSHGLMVDPGVYFYEVQAGIKTHRGSIEVVKVK